MKQPLVSFNTRKAMRNKTEIGKRSQTKRDANKTNHMLWKLY